MKRTIPYLIFLIAYLFSHQLFATHINWKQLVDPNPGAQGFWTQGSAIALSKNYRSITTGNDYFACTYQITGILDQGANPPDIEKDYVYRPITGQGPAYCVHGGAGDFTIKEFSCFPTHYWSDTSSDCVTVPNCPPGETFNQDTEQCELPVNNCENNEGQAATAFGWFGPHDTTSDFTSLSCNSGCIAVFNGTGPYNFPYSDDPDSLWFEGQFFYASAGEECVASDITEPQAIPPENLTEPDFDNGNDLCPNGWYLQPDGSCSITEEGGQDLNQNECPAGTYLATDLGQCIGFNNPAPTTPGQSGDNEPTGGSPGTEPQTGGNDGGGIIVQGSGVDTDGDGETNDEGFCTQYPDSPICKESSYVDNGCISEPACSGDAIQCAIALNTWKQRCKDIQVDENISGIKGDTTEIKDSLDEINTTLTDAFEESQDPEIVLDDSGLDLPPIQGDDDSFIHKITEITDIDLTGTKRYSAACPGVISVPTIGMGEIPFDFSLMCTFAESIGLLIALGSVLIGARIIFG